MLQARLKRYQFIIDGSKPDPGSQEPSKSGELWGITRFRPEKSFGRVLHFQKWPLKAGEACKV